MKFRPVLRYLIPEGIWLKRMIVLFSFIFLDYVVTLILCDSFHAEGNIYARNFMQTYGIKEGLTIFDSLMSIPIYVILCVDSHLVKLPREFSTKMELLLDLAFGWLIAGAHFNGALSWFWDAPNMIRQATGLITYEAIALSSFYAFSKPVWSSCFFKRRPKNID